MNRRTFLKLFGLLAVPVPAVSSVLRKRPVHKGKLELTVKLHEHYRIEVQKADNVVIDADWSKYKWQQNSPYKDDAVEILTVREDEVVSIFTTSMSHVAIVPQWDNDLKQFKPISVRAPFLGETYINDIIVEEV